MLLTFIFNAILRIEYFPSQWKVAQLVVVPKPGKPTHETTSYRPISLLPISSKLFERLFLKRLQPVIETLNLIPEHQFGFRRQHSTVEQMHRLAHYIRQCLEEKKFCSSVFLDVRQAFDKVWHIGLLYKIKKLLPHSFYNLIQSYLTDRKFKIAFQGEQTDQFNIESGVPQGSVLGPILYVLYTSDIPKDPNTTMAMFADDTAILSKNVDCVVATENLQNGLNNIQSWLNKWKIQVNKTKSTHVVFTLQNENSPRVTLNNILMPQSESVKFLGMHLDKRLMCRTLKLYNDFNRNV